MNTFTWPIAAFRGTNIQALIKFISHNKNYPCQSFDQLKIIKRYAGHSHWQNIKVTKQANDHNRSMRFNYLVNQIRIAIREGNGNINPESNDKLAQALKMAKVNFLPRSTIDKVIKRWQAGEREASEPYVLPVQGPSGTFILVECVGEKPREAQIRLNQILKKCAMSAGELHVMAHAFDHKGVIRVVNSEPFPESSVTEPTPFITLDRAEEIGIEVGAEQVKMSRSEYSGDPENSDETRHVTLLLEYICGMEDFHRVTKGLTNTFELPVKSAGLEYLPNRLVTLEQNIDRNLVLRLFDYLHESFEALSKIYTNIDPASLVAPTQK